MGKMNLERRVKCRSVEVYHVDDERMEYSVVDEYETVLVEEVGYFKKEYFFYYFAMACSIFNLIVTDNKWIAFLSGFMLATVTFLWIMTVDAKQRERERRTDLF